MIWFESLKEKPAELAQKGEAAWDRSLYVWRAWYGSRYGDGDHIAILGLVPLDFMTKTGYWWFDLSKEGVTRGMIRDAKQAFFDLDAHLGWITFAHTEVANPKATRFVSFFNFRLLGTSAGQHYHKRES